MTNALIVVDVQNDFISGSLAVPGAEEVVKGVADFLLGRGDEYEYIVATRDWHIDPGDHFSKTPNYIDSWPVHCVAGTWGAELHAPIRHHRFDAHFYKGMRSAAYSGFEGHVRGLGSDLEKWLEKRDVTAVDIVGLATDFCVKATALDAAFLAFDTTVLLPLTAPVSAAGRSAAIHEMTKAGVRLR